jgi:hypothetical protein
VKIDKNRFRSVLSVGKCSIKMESVPIVVADSKKTNELNLSARGKEMNLHDFGN